jgi:hypothetical protein
MESRPSAPLQGPSRKRRRTGGHRLDLVGPTSDFQLDRDAVQFAGQRYLRGRLLLEVDLDAVARFEPGDTDTNHVPQLVKYLFGSYFCCLASSKVETELFMVISSLSAALAFCLNSRTDESSMISSNETLTCKERVKGTNAYYSPGSKLSQRGRQHRPPTPAQQNSGKRKIARRKFRHLPMMNKCPSFWLYSLPSSPIDNGV